MSQRSDFGEKLKKTITDAGVSFGKDPLTKATIFEGYLIPSGLLENLKSALTQLFLDEVLGIIGEREKATAEMDDRVRAAIYARNSFRRRLRGAAIERFKG